MWLTNLNNKHTMYIYAYAYIRITFNKWGKILMIKLYLLTGFLGAGKTTFLTNTLEHLKGEKVGVIMNE